MKNLWHKIFPAFYGFIIYGTLRVVNDTMGKGFKFWERPLYVNIIEIFGVILVGYLFTSIIKRQERKYFINDASEITLKRFSKELLNVIGVALLVVNCTIIPMAAVTDDGLSLSDFVQINIIPTLYIVLYFTIRRGNFYVQAFVQSKIKLQQIENDRLNSELNFLKEQFSPHFLFNGLNNIYFQMDQSVPEAKKSVEKLSELLRYSLYQDQQKLVDIAKEIEFIKLYSEVHKVRKDDRMQLRMDLKEIKGKIYPHLLIPLVENAFKYVEGSKPLIEMKLSKEDDHLKFSISNSKRQIEKVKDENNGIGLTNLKRRLELLYKNEHELYITNNKESFEATLMLPIQ
ncbi:histidine kinase [Ekhidna sp.]|jgi:two-component system LytT family sensor kinase|uniref:sensor histidine kinase n=1 Tax=Ekhidna sp. TaxID=2608089 RepID=UPI0032EEFA57